MRAAPLSLTENAQSELDRYLRRVRAVLRAHPSVDADDIERDIRGHIDAELAASPAPVTEVRLRAVLDRLGSPSQWVPSEDLPIWRTALIRLRSGPEDWRLAYASFVLCVAGPLVAGAIGVLLFLASVLLSRAALELLAEEDEPVGARRWLLYPPLLVIYLGLLAAILLAPPAMLETPIRAEAVGWFPDPFWATLPLLVGVVAGAWWVSLGLALTRWHGAVRATFRPFADWFERRHGVRLAYVGLGLLALASAALVIVSR
jgi:HAAS domain-containing protein